MDLVQMFIPASEAIMKAERIHASETLTVGTPPGRRGYSLLQGVQRVSFFLAAYGGDPAQDSGGGNPCRWKMDSYPSHPRILFIHCLEMGS